MSELCRDNFKRFKLATFIIVNAYGAFLYIISATLNPLTLKVAFLVHMSMLVIVMPSLFGIKLMLLKVSKNYVSYIESKERKRKSINKNTLKVDSAGNIHKSNAKEDELMKKLLLLNEREDRRA